MESSQRGLLIDMVIERLIFKNKQIKLTSVSSSYPKQLWDYLKQGIVFNVHSRS